MPIPMRTPSLREPRKQLSVPTARTTTLKSTSTTTTTTTAPSTASSNPIAANENAATRNKTLLPVRDEVRSASSRLQQAQDSRLPQRGGLRPPQKISAQHDPAPPSGSSTVARRQSLIRPSPLKTTSTSTAKSTSTASTTSKGNAVAGPPSPVKSSLPGRENGRPISPKKTDMPPPSASSVKSSLPGRENGRPTSPKKTDMPPPPRPVRSASLRQPVRSSPGTTVSTPRGHARHRSQVVPPASTSIMKKTEPPSPVVPTTPRTRGQFSTYQQHYSPKKTVPSSTTTPSGPPADLDQSLIPSSWPEIAALQTELLQLSLLHSSSQQQHAAWQSDAEAELRTLYEAVASDYRDVLAAERAQQRQLNGQALQAWVDNCREHQGHQGFAEQIQVLSQVMQELCDLTDSVGGRYMSLVQGFESWFHRAEEIRSYRRLYPEEEADGAAFIDPLDSGWKQEVYTMTMMLELCLRQLQSLDILGYGTVEPLEGSTLLRTATGLNEMGSLMVEELQTMRKIEADIVATEREWVSQLAGQLAATASRPGIPAQAARVGMWSPLSVKS